MADGPHVLVIDSESETVEVLRAVLEPRGLRVDRVRELTTNSDPTAPSLLVIDDDGLSAPVDASLSTISLDAAVLPADGASAATLTLVPRDSNGTMIGSGCQIGLNELQLHPASLAGPVKDNRNGTYTIRVVSAEAGSVNVRTIVEGVELIDELQIVFE